MDFEPGLFRGVMIALVFVSLVIFILMNLVAKFKASARGNSGWGDFETILVTSLILLGVVIAIVEVFNNGD